MSAVVNNVSGNAAQAANAAEQAIAVNNNNQSMTRINELTKQAAADAQGTAESSLQLAALADSRRGLIGQFKI